MAEVQSWNSADFAAVKNNGAVMADFYAEWCGPCKAMMKVLDKVAAESGDNVKIGKINIDESPELTAEYQVRTVPTFIVFKNGEIVAKLIGVVTAAALTEALNKAL